MSPRPPADPARGRRETVGEAVARRAREGDPVTGERGPAVSRTAGPAGESGAPGSRGAASRGAASRAGVSRGRAPRSGAARPDPGSRRSRTAESPGDDPAGDARSRAARSAGSRRAGPRARATGERASTRPARGTGPGVGTAEERGAEPSRPAPLSPVHRRRRRVAALVAGLVLLAGLAVGGRLLLFDLGLADVEGVEVSGASAVPVEEVLAAAAVVPGGPLASVDTAGIAARVAQLPGVAMVEVGRGWPHTVTVAITERVAVAIVDTARGPAPVDATGVVYAAPVAADLPRLTFGAVGPDDPSTRAALDVLGALPDGLRAQVRTVDVSTGGGTPQVALGLTEDRQVRWGTAERGPEKASVLVALLTQPGRVYDVTSPELPTVRS
ncbi:FtsQ-type POTRA domain-containing protein [Pseudonocardia sp.]|uniref:FtsQ-type POTRA domain-containing protein n=1 Tax=Pseudonocardia sp. TaxID=60912 RepID=UPI002639CD32|nr:FtsQ-type POTRA domain-containing protein [Pseudonocardia sp.]